MRNKDMAVKEVLLLFKKKTLPLITKSVNLKVSITEMYPWIPWELVADPLGFVEPTVGTTGLSILHSILFSTTISFPSVIARDKVQTRTQHILSVIMLDT
jgi:hypothetical protein